MTKLKTFFDYFAKQLIKTIIYALQTIKMGDKILVVIRFKKSYRLGHVVV